MRTNFEKGMKTMNYTAPEMEIVAFDAEDVITASEYTSLPDDDFEG